MLCPDREKTWWGGKEASFQVFAIKAVRNFLACFFWFELGHFFAALFIPFTATILLKLEV